MCEYCDIGRPDYGTAWGRDMRSNYADAAFNIGRGQAEYVLLASAESESMQCTFEMRISYCPMCGRDLRKCGK